MDETELLNYMRDTIADDVDQFTNFLVLINNIVPNVQKYDNNIAYDYLVILHKLIKNESVSIP